MSGFMEMLPLVVVLMVAGTLSGLMAGLLGIGGGIVIVPILEFSLSYFGIDESMRMHIAVATSLAIIIPTSLSSARAHHKRGTVDVDIIKNWAPGIFIGAVIGSYLASKLDGKMLVVIFAFLAFLIGLKMLLSGKNERTIEGGMPRGGFFHLVPFLMGSLSSMMGIGGGVMGVSVMSLYKIPIHRAVSTAAFFGFLISIPGTIAFMITGLDVADLPVGNLGYVNLIALFIVAPAAFLMAPLGAALAHKLEPRQLSFMFGLFLLFISSQMIYRYVF